MGAASALLIVARILALLSLVQAYEFIRLRSAFNDRSGVWRWPELETETIGRSAVARRIFRTVLSGHGFLVCNILRIALAGAAVAAPTGPLMAGLLVLHSLTLIRWQGSFNGGSDYMALLLLAIATAALYVKPASTTILLWYVSFQACASYVKAGWAKIKNRSWRQGTALRDFLLSAEYESSALIERLTKFVSLNKLSSWIVIVFELTFPLSLLGPRICIAYIAVGCGFHLANSYALGLNRFVFAWLAAYPALYFCSQ